MYSREKNINKYTKPLVLVVDANNLMFRILFTTHKKFPHDTDFVKWKLIFLQSLFKHIKLFNPNKVIIAIDDKNSWRKKIYPKYKYSRKNVRDSSTIDFEHFYAVSNDFLEDLKNSFTNMMFLNIAECEADDIMAILCKNRLKTVDIILMSNDKDGYQLYSLSNYKQYDMSTSKIISSINPTIELGMKIILGDKNDNIPPIKPRLTRKNIYELLIKGSLNNLLNDPISSSNYERNTLLIDFNHIPVNYKNNILEAYDNYMCKPFLGRNIFNVIMKHRIGGILTSIQKYSSFIDKVKIHDNK